MIVGHHSELRPEERQVTSKEGLELAREFDCGFQEASSRYNENVNKAFEGMIAQIEKGQTSDRDKDGSACSVM